jgi:soluble lytic murein transglycosylase
MAVDAPGARAEMRELAPLDGPAADRILRERTRPVLADPAASFRAADEALGARDRSHAVWLLGEIIRRHPIVADYAALMKGRVLLQDGHSERAAATARDALAGEPGELVRARLHVLLAEALTSTGDRAGAVASWKAALDETRDEDLRASILLSIGAAEERAGMDHEAATTYRLVWYAYPLSDEAKIADHRLDVLGEFLGESMRSGTDWRRRGDRLFRKRRNEGALEAYDKALTLGITKSETRRAQKQRAHTLFRQRRYPEAVKAFSDLSQREDIPIWRARSMARAGDVIEAISEFERIATKNRGSMSARGHFLAALLLDGRGYTERARAHYLQVASNKRSGGMGSAAGWRLGWTAYREGEYGKSIAHFDRLLGRESADPIGQLRYRYWRARALEQLGDARATDEFGALARGYPLSYYGWRARDFAAANGPEPDSADLSDGRNVLRPSEIARARILLEAGLEEDARGELTLLARRARGLSERLEVAQLCTEAGDYYRAQRLVVDPYSQVLAQGPRARLEELWWYAWPSAYSDMVDEATNQPGSVEPELVYSIMREESGYRASIVSPVGARGLLQIMAPTGERLARDTGRERFHADDLFEPRTNIDLGSHYLGELSNLFEGRMSASIASYNAGPEAVRQWEPTAAGPDDEWVESIPYDQTRSYVKRVLRSLHAYRVLY